MTCRPTVQPWHGTAEDAARLLRGRSGLAWIDSSLPGGPRGRWSIVAADPRWRLITYGDDVFLASHAGPRRLTPGGLRALVELIAEESLAGAPPEEDDLPFFGGAIGYLGFELGREVESLPATTVDDVGAPDLAFGWYDAAVVHDHEADRSWLAGQPRAVEQLRADLDCGSPAHDGGASMGRSPLRANMTRARYLANVERARRYIEAGDIYQVNLSQRFSTFVPQAGFDIYEALRRFSPSPFAAYLDLRDDDLSSIEVLSSSPERLLLADGAHLETRPIKGTRPRGADRSSDERLAKELLRSEKDLAEHVMIVDLERNDLGRVARTGTVSVPEFAALESFEQVHHLTSTVTAERQADVDIGGLLRAIFPGGSITGAPKIRALQIIDELEPTVRGIYTGGIGYISAHGRVDLNVAIRTVTLADGVAHFHVGGAIVHDSDAEAEYTETLDKARGMARALGVALPDEPAEPAAEGIGVPAAR